MNPVALPSHDANRNPKTGLNESKPFLSIEQLKKKFESGFVLSIDSLEWNQGYVISILGPTGAGKTTVLRCFAGIETFDAGSISIDEVSLQKAIHKNSKRIVMVHQNVILIRGTVEQNIQYGLKLRNDPDRQAKTESIIERFALTDISKKSVDCLSKGQKTLVGLARAFVLEPEVLLLDEPTSSLDPARVEMIENEIRRLQDEYNSTVVVATHNLFQAKRLANQTCLILDGQLVENSETTSFFSSPRKQITKDFLEGKIVY